VCFKHIARKTTLKSVSRDETLDVFRLIHFDNVDKRFFNGNEIFSMTRDSFLNSVLRYVTSRRDISLSVSLQLLCIDYARSECECIQYMQREKESLKFPLRSSSPKLLMSRDQRKNDLCIVLVSLLDLSR